MKWKLNITNPQREKLVDKKINIKNDIYSLSHLPENEFNDYKNYSSPNYLSFFHTFNSYSFPIIISNDKADVIFTNNKFSKIFKPDIAKYITTASFNKLNNISLIDIIFHDIKEPNPIIDEIFLLEAIDGEIKSFHIVSFVYNSNTNYYLISFIQEGKDKEFLSYVKNIYLKFQVLQNQAITAEEYCRDSITKLQKLISFQIGFIHLYSESQNEFILAYQIGLPPEMVASIQYFTESDPTYKTLVKIADLEELLATDAINNYSIGEYFQKYFDNRFNSLFFIPLLFNKEIQGSIIVISDEILVKKDKRIQLLIEFSKDVGHGIYEKRLITQLIEQNLIYEQKNRLIDNINRVKSDFVLNMCRDIRKPLNLIVDYSSILFSENCIITDEEEKIFKSDILKNSKYLITLINDINDLSDIEAGKIDLYLTNHSVVDIMNNLIANLEPFLESNYLTIKIDYGLFSDYIMTDLHKFNKIFYGILSNAIKYSDNHATIRIRVAIVDDNFKFNLRIKSSALSHNDLDKLFVPFEYLKSETNTISLGLGLSLTKKLVELLQGSIVIEKDNKDIIDILLTLPNINNLNNIREINFRKDFILTNRIHDCLIIGTNYYDNKWLKNSLKRFEITSLCEDKYHDIDIVEYIKSKKSKVIIFDISTETHVVWEQLSRIKSDIEISKIPIIVISNIDVKWKAFQYGAIDYFKKPIDINFIVQRIKKLNML